MPNHIPSQLELLSLIQNVSKQKRMIKNQISFPALQSHTHIHKRQQTLSNDTTTHFPKSIWFRKQPLLEKKFLKKKKQENEDEQMESKFYTRSSIGYCNRMWLSVCAGVEV